MDVGVEAACELGMRASRSCHMEEQDQKGGDIFKAMFHFCSIAKIVKFA